MACNIRRNLRDFFASVTGSSKADKDSQTPKPSSPEDSKNPTLGTMNPELDGFIDLLSLNFNRRLRHRIESGTGEAGENSPEQILNRLYVAMNHQDSQHLHFRYEATKPASEEFRDEKFHFHEALFTINDDSGDAIAIQDLFETLDSDKENGTLGAHFRLLLIFQQVQHFSRRYPGRLSVNIFPKDMDSEWFRETLSQGLMILNADRENWDWKNNERLILEAVENGDWNLGRLSYLKGLQKKTGVNLAIDDYGSEYNQEQVLKRLKVLHGGREDTDLIIKLDGVLVKDFINAEDPDETHPLVQRLKEIKKHYENAQTVLEWASSDEEIVKIKERLSQFGLEDFVQLVQSRELKYKTKSELLDEIKKVESKKKARNDNRRGWSGPGSRFGLG